MSLPTSLNLLRFQSVHQKSKQSSIPLRNISFSKLRLTPFESEEQFFEPIHVPEYPLSPISVQSEDVNVTYTDFFKDRIKKLQTVRSLVRGNMTVGQKIAALHCTNPDDIHSKQFWVKPSRVILAGEKGLKAVNLYDNPSLMPDGMNTNVSLVKDQYKDVILPKSVVVPTTLHIPSKAAVNDILRLCKDANISLWTGGDTVSSIVSQYYALPGMLIASTDPVVGGAAANGAFVMNVSSMEAAGVMHGQPISTKYLDTPIQIHIKNQQREFVGVQDVISSILHSMSYFAADITFKNNYFIEVYDKDNNLTNSQMAEVCAALQTLPSVVGVIALTNATLMNYLRDTNRGVLGEIFSEYGLYALKQDVMARVYETITVDLNKVQAKASVYHGPAALGGVGENMSQYFSKTSSFIREHEIARSTSQDLQLGFHLLPEHCNVVVLTGGVTELTQGLQLQLEAKRKQVSLQVPVFIIPDSVSTRIALKPLIDRVRNTPLLTLLPPQEAEYKSIATYIERLVVSHREKYPQTSLHKLRHDAFFGRESRFQLKKLLNAKDEAHTVCSFAEKSSVDVAKRLRVMLGMDAVSEADMKKYARTVDHAASSEEAKLMGRNDQRHMDTERQRHMELLAKDSKPVDFETDAAIIASSFVLLTNSITLSKDKTMHFSADSPDICMYMNTQHAVASAIHNALGQNMAEYKVMNDSGSVVSLSSTNPFVSENADDDSKPCTGLLELPSTIPLTSYTFEKNDSMRIIPKAVTHRIIQPVKSYEMDGIENADGRLAVAAFRVTPTLEARVLNNVWGATNYHIQKLLQKRAGKLDSAYNTWFASLRAEKLTEVDREEVVLPHEGLNVLFPHFKHTGYVNMSDVVATPVSDKQQNSNFSSPWWNKEDYVGLPLVKINDKCYDFLSNLHYGLNSQNISYFEEKVDKQQNAPYALFLGDLGATLTYDMQDFKEGGVDATTMKVSSSVAEILASTNCKVVFTREIHNNLARALKAHGILALDCLNLTEICSFAEEDDKVSIMQMESNLLPSKMPEVVLHTFKSAAAQEEERVRTELQNQLRDVINKEISSKSGEVASAQSYGTVDDVDAHKSALREEIATREALAASNMPEAQNDGRYENALSDVLKSQYTTDAMHMLSSIPENLRKELSKVKGKVNSQTNMRMKCTLPMELADLVWFRCGNMVNAGAELRLREELDKKQIEDAFATQFKPVEQ